MKLFEVSSDSTCDFYASEYKKYNVHHVPLTFIIENKNSFEECVDEFKTENEYVEFYKKIRLGGMPKTAILNLQAHIDHFTNLAQQGYTEIVHVTISYGLSPTLDNANAALKIVQEQYPNFKVYAIESNAATIIQGFLVKVACSMRDSGKTASETAAYLNKIKNETAGWAIVNDLFYLKRGGRVSGAAAMIGTVLNLKPILTFNKEGKLVVIKKEMGVKKAIKGMLMDFKKYTLNKDFPLVEICHTDNIELAKEVKNAFKTEYGIEASIKYMGPIIGSHVGPGAVVFTFISEQKRIY